MGDIPQASKRLPSKAAFESLWRLTGEWRWKAMKLTLVADARAGMRDTNQTSLYLSIPCQSQTHQPLTCLLIRVMRLLKRVM